MKSRSRGQRRGSALILVLMMTLAVAGLSIAAIFLSSSAGLLSRYYDRERDFRLAAEAALAQLRSRLPLDTLMAFPDTGVIQLLAGFQPTDASGASASNVRVNVYAAVTGDTSGLATPHLTLIAASYDANGTRHVRRMDLRRESFSHYAFFTDSFNAAFSFGPGVVHGRVHSNESWRSGTGAAAATYVDTVTAVTALVGTGTYASDTSTAVPRIHYPADSTYPRLQAYADTAKLAFTPVSGSGAGWVKGSRLAFVTVDADGDGSIDADEGFARVFDLADGMDTTRLSVGLVHDQSLFGFTRRQWDNADIQNQCGAWYLRSGRWHFFPVATHRAVWARAVIQATGASAFPDVNPSDMDDMDDYSRTATNLILNQETARCYPAGSPQLMTTERMTNLAGVIGGGVGDTIPFGVIVPPAGWPASAPSGYGGSDTTFTSVVKTCTVSTGGTTGYCNAGTAVTLGSWRAFGGTPVSGIASTIRQPGELPYLWPYGSPRNPKARGMLYASSGPLVVSGELRGSATLLVNGSVRLIEGMSVVNDPSDPSAAACTDRFGLVAVGDILVVDNGLTRGRRIGSIIATISKHLGPARDVELFGSYMSLRGTVGIENYASTGFVPQSCPASAAANTSAGCLRTSGALVMRRFTPHYNGANTGVRYTGMKDPCQATDNRPPFFPLTNRYTFVRTLEIEPSRANTPAKIRSILLRLKGKSL
jgi:hypothetical protein